MLLLMIERGMPIDIVLTADTGMEFPEMYDHLAKLDEYLYRERGIHLTMLRHPKGFEYMMFEEEKQKISSIENRQKLGVPLYGNGWPGVKVRWCTGQLKTHLISKEVNRLKGEYQALHYVGIAADEPKRIKNEQYPLVDWGITEAEALKLCYDRGYDWGGLYEIYHRCSCWCCPLQRIDELRKLRHHHPELWKRLRDMDQRAIAQFGHNPLGQFKQNWTVERLEQRFAAEDAQISVFLSSGKDSTMTEKQKQECSEVETMLQGTPKQNVLVSFDGKPPKTLEELEKEQKRQKKKHKDRGEARLISSLDYFRELNFSSVLLRLLLAMIFGGMIGLERGRKHRAAGFRTYMLVCLGATLTSILSQYLYVRLDTDWLGFAETTSRQIDVSRFGAQVYSGIGFLAAGTIIVTGRQEVKGLTTAAGLWASACMGIAIGAGFYECVVIAFVLMFLCIHFLPVLEVYLLENARNMNIYVELKSLDEIGVLLGAVKTQNIQIYGVEIDRGGEEHHRYPSAVLSVRLEHHQQHPQVLAALSEITGVIMIEEI